MEMNIFAEIKEELVTDDVAAREYDKQSNMWLLVLNMNSDGDFPVHDRTVVEKLLGKDVGYHFFGVFETRETVVNILKELLESSLIVLRSHVTSRDYLLDTIEEFIEITEDVITFLKEEDESDLGYRVCRNFGNQYYGLQFMKIEYGENILDVAFDICLE